METVTTKVRRCAFYLRVSEDDGNKHENSIAAQRAACMSYVHFQIANGFPMEVVEQFEEMGESAKNLERPKVKALLRLAKAKGVDVIVVYKLDRLSRSLLDFCQLAETFKADGIELVSTTQNLDSSTSHGRMMINILMTFAQYERELIQERTQATMRQRAKAGKWNGGWIPFGYDYNVETKTLTPNAGEKAHFVRMCDMVLAGDSLERIAHYMKKAGVTRKPRQVRKGKGGEKASTLTRSLDTPGVRRMLEAPVYAGLTRVGKEHYKAVYEGLIPREVWEQVNTLIRKSKPQRVGVVPSKHGYLLNGILWCGCCEQPMSGYRGGKGHEYYACPRHRRGDGRIRCTTANLRVAALDEFAMRLLGQIGRLPEVVDGFVTLAKEGQRGHEHLRRDLSVVTGALEAARSSKQRIKEEITASATVVSRKEWRAELEKVLKQEKSLQAELTEISGKLGDDTQDAEIRQQIMAALGSGAALIESLPREGKDQFLRAVIRRVVVNTPSAEKAKKASVVVEKGAYLLNVELLESGLAPMLYKHCAANSTELGNWLPG
jgi:site-specific DNA recombinase